MALTRKFKETVAIRANRDKKFRDALLQAAVDELLAGDLSTAKILLRDYINATITLEKLAEQLHKSDKSIQRMLSPNGNPTSENLIGMLSVIQKIEGITLTAQVRRQEVYEKKAQHDYDPSVALESQEAIAIFMADAFETGDAKYIAKALGVVARAKGMAAIAEETGLSREQLYRSFSEGGNPTLKSTLAVMRAVGVDLTAKSQAKR